VTRLARIARALLVLLALAGSPELRAQEVVDGYVSFLVDAFPHVHRAPGIGEDGVAELRARLFVEKKIDAGRHLTLTLSGFVEGLLGDRPGNADTAALVRPQELFIEADFERFDLRAGFTRIVWGRLDEVQPTDVVNPLDLSRFFLEGRSEARLPVALVRGRAFLPGDATLEAVLVPAFRPGRFDQLGERSSPFNLERDAVVCARAASCAAVQPARHEPGARVDNLQGGARLSATLGRVDWAVSAYRGFRAFPVYAPRPIPLAALPPVDAVFPRFTMIGADFETVRGVWGVRGELAAFVSDTFQAPGGLGAVAGHSIEGGVGVDRKAGEYRVSGNVIVSHRAGDRSAAGRAEPAGVRVSDTDVTLVAAADRSFARQTRLLRQFAVYNPSERTGFARTIAAVSLRDNLWLEGSLGWFLGEGDDAIGRFADRDVVYARVKFYF
jgi:hypothetical protein